MAQLPSGPQELTVSKLLPGKHVECQLTKGQEEKKKKKTLGASRASSGPLWGGDASSDLVRYQTRKANENL